MSLHPRPAVPALLAGPGLDCGTPRPQTLTEALEEARHGGAGVRLLSGEKAAVEVSAAQILDRAALAAASLAQLGVRRGDRVVLMLPTGVDFLAGLFGTLLAGGIPVPVAPVPIFGSLERTLSTLRHILADCEAKVLVADARTAAAGDALLGGSATPASLVQPAELLAPRAATPFPSPSPDDVALLQYTSGTTSMPKGVELTHRALLANVLGIGDRTGMSSADVGVSWLPLFHDMGLIGALFASVVWRWPLVLLPTEAFLMHPYRWLRAISESRATLSVAPNFAYRLACSRIDDAHLAGIDLGSWRTALNGSEAIDRPTVEAFAERFGAAGYAASAMTPVYGLAENCLAATFPPSGEPVRSFELCRDSLERDLVVRPATPSSTTSVVSVGTPLLGQKVAILDDAGAVRSELEVGEVAIAGACVMRGYHHDEEASARALRGGWLHTGDLGFVAGGRLHITGRAKELIIRRGRNYYPYDIERVAGAVAGASAAAFGCENPAAGTEDLVLIVESRERQAAAQDDLRKRIAAEVLAEVGIAAERIVFCPSRSLPRTTSGKLQRSLCKRRWLEGTLPVTG